MSNQQTTLFGDLYREPLAVPQPAAESGQTARARATDPSTSHEAAARMNESGEARHNREHATDLVWMHPGLTSRELSELPDAKLDRYEMARRLPEAEAEGVVRKGPKRKCKSAGTPAVTWIPGECC